MLLAYLTCTTWVLPDPSVMEAEPVRDALVTEHAFLEPGLPQDLDAQALVVGVVAREVAV